MLIIIVIVPQNYIQLLTILPPPLKIVKSLKISYLRLDFGLLLFIKRW